jgi:23S rRNA pseudouridine1911/1915/1917 synthase
MRLDAFLARRFPHLSRSAAARAVREGQVVSAGRALKPSSLVRGGEELRLTMPDLLAIIPEPPIPPVVHQDPRLVAFSKPPDLLCHPVGAQFAWSLIGLARKRFPQDELRLCHRLDRDTSGVVLLARDLAADQFVKAAFKARQVRKTYWAIVRGCPSWNTLTVDEDLGDDRSSPIGLKRGVVAQGQSASTSFRVLARLKQVSLISCRPHTGRTHQIRVHLAFAGAPILGDRIYGQPPEVFLSIYEGRPLPDLAERLAHPRHCLHARALHVPHPDGGEVHILAPMPGDMAGVLQRAGLGPDTGP